MLELPQSQASHLASNMATIAESKFNPHYVLRAILLRDEVIGMLAYCQEIDEPKPDLYWLFRLMIAPDQQKKGYGGMAVRLAISEMADFGARTIRTMHKPENEPASRLYKSLGFAERGCLDDGDVLLELHVSGA